MTGHPSEELSKHLLEFQSLFVRQAYRWKRTQMSLHIASHKSMLEEIWSSANLSEEGGKWRKIGFATEAPKWEIQRVGYLGLENMHGFVKKDKEYYQKIILEQINRPAERRCPFAKTSIEATELLCDYWDISTGSFFRLWNEMEATSDDFPKVSALVRSQLKFALKDEVTKQLYEFEKDMLEVEYKVIRDRQLKELELGDDLLSKTPVRNLRSKLYTESYEFVKQQRIKCLLRGDCGNRRSLSSKKWRFYRLSPNAKFLHYCDFTEKSYIREGIEDLPERNLKFSLMSGPDTTLADFLAVDMVQFSEWTDGFNMLFDKNIGCKDTAEFIQVLTEIGVKVKLLDLSGERVEIPQSVEVPDELPIIDKNGNLLAKPVRFIGVVLTIVLSALTLSGGLIILIRISKIKAGSKGTSLGFGIKLPFYFSSISLY
ncbi:13165_t:CDS:2 [Entrophospora sp. SA101]|nr:13165_t:CDS:2 [Entrophospora sp. SA101]